MSRLLHSFHSLADFTDRAIEIAVILAIALALTFLAVRLTDFAFRRLSRAADALRPERAAQRAKTLAAISRSTIKTLLISLSCLITLGKVGFDLTPILASAGILGIAIGFGAQNLIKDLLSGFFIVLEDQYGVGDMVVIEDKSGIVEAMNLRITRLRNLDGDLITIPNGTIGAVANQSKGWSRAVVDVGVSLQENIDRALAILTEEARLLYAEWPEKILEEPLILGINEFQANRISIRLMAKTLPMEQWNVGRELRRRIKNAFDREGIEIPGMAIVAPHWKN
jgi:small conductance mechanosensitive channel